MGMPTLRKYDAAPPILCTTCSSLVHVFPLYLGDGISMHGSSVFFFFNIKKKKKKLFFLVVHVLSIVESVICVEEYGRNVFIYYVHEKRDTK